VQNRLRKRVTLPDKSERESNACETSHGVFPGPSPVTGGTVRSTSTWWTTRDLRCPSRAGADSAQRARSAYSCSVQCAGPPIAPDAERTVPPVTGDGPGKTPWDVSQALLSRSLLSGSVTRFRSRFCTHVCHRFCPKADVSKSQRGGSPRQGTGCQ
jgi:hypothetical protein